MLAHGPLPTVNGTRHGRRSCPCHHEQPSQ
jgi:hypothetical protein